jgi:ribosome-associated protein
VKPTHQPDEYNAPERPTAHERSSGAKALQDIGAALVELTDRDLTAVPLDDGLREAVEQARRLPDKKAKERQVQYIGRLMRSVEIEPIQKALEAIRRGNPRAARLADVALAWRDHLIAKGDAAIGTLLEIHPELDRQELRQLVRQAKKDGANQEARSVRELGKLLRELGISTLP